MRDLLQTKSVMDFKNALSDSGFKEGEDGFMVSGDGQSTGIKYHNILDIIYLALRVIV